MPQYDSDGTYRRWADSHSAYRGVQYSCLLCTISANNAWCIALTRLLLCMFHISVKAMHAPRTKCAMLADHTNRAQHVHLHAFSTSTATTGKQHTSDFFQRREFQYATAVVPEAVEWALLLPAARTVLAVFDLATQSSLMQRSLPPTGALSIRVTLLVLFLSIYYIP